MLFITGKINTSLRQEAHTNVLVQVLLNKSLIDIKMTQIQVKLIRIKPTQKFNIVEAYVDSRLPSQARYFGRLRHKEVSILNSSVGENEKEIRKEERKRAARRKYGQNTSTHNYFIRSQKTMNIRILYGKTTFLHNLPVSLYYNYVVLDRIIPSQKCSGLLGIR